MDVGWSGHVVLSLMLSLLSGSRRPARLLTFEAEGETEISDLLPFFNSNCTEPHPYSPRSLLVPRATFGNGFAPGRPPSE